MSKILQIIGESNFEKVRTRIAQILSIELAAQKILNQDALNAELAKPVQDQDPDLIIQLELNISAIPELVYEERFVRPQPTELINGPIINVIFTNAPLSDLVTFEDQIGEDKYQVQCYVGAKSKENEDGDKIAALKLQRCLAICRSILMSPNYAYLEFPEFVGDAVASDLQIAAIQNGADDANFTMGGKFDFNVKMTEEVEQIVGLELLQNDTTLRLHDSEKGYVWTSGDLSPDFVDVNTSIIGGGTINSNPLDLNQLPKGTLVLLNATPDVGFRFDNWLIDSINYANQLVSFIATKTLDAIATFIEQFQLTTSVVGEGTITPASGLYDDGDVVTITAEPIDPETTELDRIEVDSIVVSNTSPYDLLMDGAKTAIAYFVALFTIIQDVFTTNPTSNILVDATTNGNNLVVKNIQNADFSTGVIGLDSGIKIVGGNPISLDFDFYTTSVGVDNRLVDCSGGSTPNGFLILFKFSLIRVYMSNGAVRLITDFPASQISLTEKNNLTLDWDGLTGGLLTVAVNGTEYTSNATQEWIGDSAETLKFGSSVSLTLGLKGQMNTIKMTNNTLTGWWTLEEGTGTLIIDKLGVNNLTVKTNTGDTELLWATFTDDKYSSLIADGFTLFINEITKKPFYAIYSSGIPTVLSLDYHTYIGEFTDIGMKPTINNLINLPGNVDLFNLSVLLGLGWYGADENSPLPFNYLDIINYVDSDNLTVEKSEHILKPDWINPDYLDGLILNEQFASNNWSNKTGTPTWNITGGLLTITFDTGIDQAITRGTLLTAGQDYVIDIELKNNNTTPDRLKIGNYTVATSEQEYFYFVKQNKDGYNLHRCVLRNVLFTDLSIGLVGSENTGGAFTIKSINTYKVNLTTETNELTEYSDLTTNLNLPVSLTNFTAKKLYKFAVLGDSIMANYYGGDIPIGNDEGTTERPPRLTVNNIPRRIYDYLKETNNKWNTPIYKRIDNADWTKSGVFTNTQGVDAYTPIYSDTLWSFTQETNAYCEITIPDGFENCAIILQKSTTLQGNAMDSAIGITLNGGSIATHGNSVIDSLYTTAGWNNPWWTEEYQDLPSGANTIRITKSNNTDTLMIWGIMYWTGNAFTLHNISRGGATMKFMYDGLTPELMDNNYDTLFLQVTGMNEAGDSVGVDSTQRGFEYTLNLWKQYCENIITYSTHPFGDNGAGTNYYTLYNTPNTLLEYYDRIKYVCFRYNIPYINIMEYFKELIEGDGGTLDGGEGGLTYTTDGQHPNELCAQLFADYITSNAIKDKFNSTPTTSGVISQLIVKE